MNCVLIPELCSRDVTSCLWETESNISRQIMLVSVYWDITYPDIPETSIECIVQCNTHNIPFICSLDSNPYRTLWGCNKDNPRGKTLKEFLLSEGVNLHNKGSQPTFINQRSSTIINIALTDPFLADICHNWRVHDNLSHSDHAAIRLDLLMTTPTPFLKFGKTLSLVQIPKNLQHFCPKLYRRK